MIVRLNKYLSECGIASRRKADELIKEGRVSVNSELIIELGRKINTEVDEVTIDGEKLKTKNKVYYLLNKPKGVISSTSDEKNRKTVVDLIKTREKIYPIGRLDYNTTGVLLLTNDGELSNFLTHPKNGIEREYEVVLDKELEQNDKKKLLSGIYIDRKKSLFTNISFPKRNNYSKVRVITVEGRNHFVKRMFDNIGYKVKELTRIRFGNITVHDLNAGQYKKLSKSDLKKLLSFKIDF